MNNKYDTILLDYYGTIVAEDGIIIREIFKQIDIDNGHEVLKSIQTHWYKLFVEYCCTCKNETFKTQTEIEYLSLNRSFEHAGLRVEKKYLETLLFPMFEYWSTAEAFDDAVSFIKQKENEYNLKIVSNIDDKYISQSMNNIGIENIPLVTSEGVKSYKPNIDIFLEATRYETTKKNKMVLIGDSLSLDYQGAINFGIDFILIDRENKHGGRDDIKRVSTFSDLDSILYE